jgi:hypothetical protein
MNLCTLVHNFALSNTIQIIQIFIILQYIYNTLLVIAPYLPRTKSAIDFSVH